MINEREISPARGCVSVWIPKIQTKRSWLGVRDAEEQVQGQHLPEGKEITQVNLMLGLLHPPGSKICPPVGRVDSSFGTGFAICTVLSLSVQAAQIERISFESHFTHWFFFYLRCHPLNTWAEQAFGVFFGLSGILCLLSFQGLFIWGW